MHREFASSEETRDPATYDEVRAVEAAKIVQFVVVLSGNTSAIIIFFVVLAPYLCL
jgi:hypothetical protein